ncbi:resolvase [Campylobacter gastrosuis]|uniref:Resolvase n=1 Tax=Campylobacter gastrosuis TaxID=2974576 RepID=A0ABT7HUF4_9BACT|nr:resolvase [Campylobacter gastrosuis]MDL0090083.1 resolvase [Campylobacter gastrosuis]
MQWQFDYIKANIEPKLIRAIATLDDESLKLTMAGVICKLTSGLKRLPNKRYKSDLAHKLILKGVNKKRVIELTKISESTYFNILKRIKNGKSND